MANPTPHTLTLPMAILHRSQDKCVQLFAHRAHKSIITTTTNQGGVGIQINHSNTIYHHSGHMSATA